MDKLTLGDALFLYSVVVWAVVACHMTPVSAVITVQKDDEDADL